MSSIRHQGKVPRSRFQESSPEKDSDKGLTSLTVNGSPCVLAFPAGPEANQAIRARCWNLSMTDSGRFVSEGGGAFPDRFPASTWNLWGNMARIARYGGLLLEGELEVVYLAASFLLDMFQGHDHLKGRIRLEVYGRTNHCMPQICQAEEGHRGRWCRGPGQYRLRWVTVDFGPPGIGDCGTLHVVVSSVRASCEKSQRMRRTWTAMGSLDS